MKLSEQIRGLQCDNPEECHRIDHGWREAINAAAALAEQHESDHAAELAAKDRVIERLVELYRDARYLVPGTCEASVRRHDVKTESNIQTALEGR